MAYRAWDELFEVLISRQQAVGKKIGLPIAYCRLHPAYFKCMLDLVRDPRKLLEIGFSFLQECITAFFGLIGHVG